MRTQRERFESYFRLPGANDPESETTLLAVADAYDDAEKTGRMFPEQLQVIIDAVSSPRAKIWQNCCSLLSAASERWREAAEGIRQMACSSKANVRFKAICSLGRRTPSNIINHVLTAGLIDRSSRVRWKAAEQAERLDQQHLLPEVTAAFAAENNEKVRDSIEVALRFLRDGYIVRPQPNGSYEVFARLGNGGGSSVIDVSKDEFDAKGISAIVSEMRERHGNVAASNDEERGDR